LFSLFLILFAHGALAVGWEEVLSTEMESKGISIESKFREFNDCMSFEVKLPVNLFFEDLDGREFSSARYVAISDGKVTFPLSGTMINLQTALNKTHIETKGICISSGDLDRAYIAANYLGPQGSVPMVVYFKLKNLE
jgi:hypothetical protein